MSIEVWSKRKTKVPQDVLVIDVTKNGTDPTFVKFSPFYPHGGIEGIPVPGFTDLTTVTVEGAWQGLKAFEREGPDLSFLKKSEPKKRSVSGARGVVLGHRYGEGSESRLLEYVDARKLIYVPLYEHVLRTCLSKELLLLKGLVDEGNRVLLLDYDVNGDVENTQTPLSHASIVVRWVNDIKN
jgi:hypothetical protein